MLSRMIGRVNGEEFLQSPGLRPYAQRIRTADATAGNITVPVVAVLNGWLDRSGPGAGYGDTMCSADAILAACPDLCRGDSFDFWITSSVAFANTLVAGAGITFAGTSGVAASSTRTYLLTLLSEPRRTRTFSGSTTNAGANITNVSDTDLQNIGIGMVVTGTNIPASTTIIAIDLANKRIVMSANATGTADNVAVTATPQFEMRGVSTAGN